MSYPVKPFLRRLPNRFAGRCGYSTFFDWLLFTLSDILRQMSRQKEIPGEKERLLAEIKEISDNRPSNYGSDVQTLSRFAELLSLVSDEHAQSAAKVERQTDKLIVLTWCIVVLTVALVLFTIVLYKDTHTLVEHETLKKHQALQNPQRPP